MNATPTAREIALEMLRVIRERGRPVIIEWELRRILYNLALAVFFLLTPGRDMLIHDMYGMLGVLFYAILANLCFCLGHVLDLVLVFIQFRSRVLSLAVFGIGTLLACGITMYMGDNVRDFFPISNAGGTLAPLHNPPF